MLFSPIRSRLLSMLQTMPGVKPLLSLICKKMPMCTVKLHLVWEDFFPDLVLRQIATTQCSRAHFSVFFFLVLSIKARPSAQLFICKWHLIFLWKDGHKDSLWERGLRQLGNGVYQSYICALPFLVVHGSFKWRGPCFSDKTIAPLKITVKMIFIRWCNISQLGKSRV